MDVDKCVTVIIWIWWLKPALPSAELYKTQHETWKKNRCGSKTGPAIMWHQIQTSGVEVEANGWLLSFFPFWKLQIFFFFNDSTFDYDIISHITSKEQRHCARLWDVWTAIRYQLTSPLVKTHIRGEEWHVFKLSESVTCLPRAPSGGT